MGITSRGEGAKSEKLYNSFINIAIVNVIKYSSFLSIAEFRPSWRILPSTLFQIQHTLDQEDKQLKEC